MMIIIIVISFHRSHDIIQNTVNSYYTCIQHILASFLEGHVHINKNSPYNVIYNMYICTAYSSFVSRPRFTPGHAQQIIQRYIMMTLIYNIYSIFTFDTEICGLENGNTAKRSSDKNVVKT